MRRILVAGNWKMHGSPLMVSELIQGILNGIAATDHADIAVFPPYPYLAQVQSLASRSRLRWGAQDMNPNVQGAYTGEVSASMLVDFGCEMVLVGHSERRTLYAESDALVAEKFIAAQNNGLLPVLCVGETLEQRRDEATEQVVGRQIDAVLERSGVAALAQAVIAYEPVWAIGTGLTATPDQAQAVHAFIRDKIAQQDGTISGQLRILYGGSVKGANAAELFKEKDIDGGLIGGAALTAEDFLAIYMAAGTL